MGNPKFYFFPEPDGSHKVDIDLGEGLAEFFFDFDVERVTGVALDGGMYRSTTTHRQIITIQRDRFTAGEDLAIKFAALQNHLDRGFSCAFAVDSSHAWCYPITTFPSGGDRIIEVSGDPFTGVTGTNTPLAHDYVNIIAQNPNLVFEQNKITPSFSAPGHFPRFGGRITLVNNIAFSYSAPSFVTHYRYFPILKRPNSDVGQNIITNEGGRLFSLSIRLVVDTAAMFAFHPDVNISAGQANQGSWVGDPVTGGVFGGLRTLDRPGMIIDLKAENAIPKVTKPWWA